jgi:hypothetical protein
VTDVTVSSDPILEYFGNSDVGSPTQASDKHHTGPHGRHFVRNEHDDSDGRGHARDPCSATICSGTAAKNANVSEIAKLLQERTVPTPATIAPGITNITALSITSIVAMDRVSDAKARPSAVGSVTPFFTAA